VRKGVSHTETVETAERIEEKREKPFNWFDWFIFDSTTLRRSDIATDPMTQRRYDRIRIQKTGDSTKQVSLAENAEQPIHRLRRLNGSWDRNQDETFRGAFESDKSV